MGRKRWILAVLAAGTLAVSAAAVRPGLWSADRAAHAVGVDLASGDAGAVAGASVPTLRPFLGDGHLQAATLPLRGARLRSVRLSATGATTALARIRYSGGRSATVALTLAQGGRWQVEGIR